MSKLRLAVVMFIGALSVGAGARAQNVVVESSSFFAPGAALPRTCADQRDLLRRELNSFPVLPSRWEWMVVCDDASWQMFLRMPGQAEPGEDMSGSDAGFGETVYASTNLDAHITVLRGTTLLYPDNFMARPEHVVAHELGHILQNTADEEKAERQAQFWLDARRRGGANVIAGGGHELVVVTAGGK